MAITLAPYNAAALDTEGQPIVTSFAATNTTGSNVVPVLKTDNQQIKWVSVGGVVGGATAYTQDDVIGSLTEVTSIAAIAGGGGFIHAVVLGIQPAPTSTAVDNFFKLWLFKTNLSGTTFTNNSPHPITLALLQQLGCQPIYLDGDSYSPLSGGGMYLSEPYVIPYECANTGTSLWALLTVESAMMTLGASSQVSLGFSISQSY